jgi:alkylation response protein AidB-like acyl-CoA dehydrogenase
MTAREPEEVRAFVATTFDPEMSLLEWRRALHAAGFAAPTWPVRFGGLDATAAQGAAIAATLRECAVPGAPDSVAMSLAAPTLLAHDSDELCERYLERCATGEDVWCQLFSEPDAGSDLASLTTRATLDGDGFVIAGQKVWTTGARQADFGLLLARTNWDVPKHRGITAFVVSMRQSGVEVRPLVQMNGYQSFNEVFLNGAVVGRSDVIGAIDGGWAVALTTLAHERRLTRTREPVPAAAIDGRLWREARAEARASSEPHRWYPQRAGRPDLLIEHARRADRSRDPVIRQRIASTLAFARAARLTADRASAARMRGREPGAEGSIGKLATSEIARRSAAVHASTAGTAAMLSGPTSSLDGVVAEILVSVPGQSIAGGTDEIQRNILAERVLGLPREPAVDREVAFRDVPRSS